ncbi:hypothetical protein NDU88_002689 [Pleurodeles waltl]|uniref:Uncharacterized protein n=1 Tax=Pleurodeles waltl TaxID=8319 RepID=A0AAV7NIL3_PLEWA|nr:hypothetical protein NDU88_002689 [Pleurodeles waltl]
MSTAWSVAAALMCPGPVDEHARRTSTAWLAAEEGRFFTCGAASLVASVVSELCAAGPDTVARNARSLINTPTQFRF